MLKWTLHLKTGYVMRHSTPKVRFNSENRNGEGAEGGAEWRLADSVTRPGKGATE